MITIIADPHGFRAPAPDVLYVAGPGGYVAARSAIRRALDNDTALTVHVADRLVLYWLEDLDGYDGVYWVPIEPEADYRRLFGVDPTPPFTAELLAQLDLATLSPPPPGVAVEPAGWVLGERVHHVWAAPHSSPAHLSQLVAWAITTPEGIEPRLQPLAQVCLANWSRGEAGYGGLRAGSLPADAAALARRAALQRYDPAWLREQGLDGAAPPLTLKESVWIAALRGAAPLLESYWRARLLDADIDAGVLTAMVGTLSGWSTAELRAAEQCMLRNPGLISASLIESLRRRFAGLPQAAAAIDGLAALVPPPPPTLPEEGWDDERWLQWATGSYMPYFAWTVRSGQQRDHQQACARAYERWLKERYPHWLTRAGSPLITRQFTAMRDLLASQPHAVVIWLVADGLTWWQGQLLREICRHRGLHPQRHEIGVSLLPSITDVSKRALVTGMPVDTPPRASIAQAARDKLARSGIGGTVGFQAQELLAALDRADPPRCLIWFANFLDSMAHDRTTFSDDSMVRAYLEQLGDGLRQLVAACAERGLIAHALVGSDHGSTILPAEAITLKVPQAAREVIDVWEDAGDQRAATVASARAAVVVEGQRPQLDQPDQWHFLERVLYQLPQDYLVPQGYAAVGRRPTGWSHGGLTPEETLVPLMHLSPEPLETLPLKLTLTGQARPRQASALTLVLTNPNQAPLDHISIRIADHPPVTAERLPAMGRIELTVTLPARAIDGAELVLPWELEGSILGVEHRQQGEARIGVRRLQTSVGPEDLFG
jgi:hypothetical protein